MAKLKTFQNHPTAKLSSEKRRPSYI